MKIIFLKNKETGEILLSTHRHDYVSDGSAFIDGGQDGYFRCSESNGYILTPSTTEDLHKYLRHRITWGVRTDKEGNLIEPRDVKIKDLTTEHIEAILETQKSINKLYKKVMEQEINLRNSEDSLVWSLGGEKTISLNLTPLSFSSKKVIGNFNASGDSLIDQIKEKSSELVDLINSFKGDEEYKKLAIINIAQGQMWAVKSLF